MPSRGRTASQYREEYVAFIERLTDDLGDMSGLEDAETWAQHVAEYIMGRSGLDLTEAQQQFGLDAFDFFNESLASGGIRAEPDTNRFRDVFTGHFVSRIDALDFLRRIPFFGLFSGGDSEP